MRWSKSRLLKTVHWHSVKQLIDFHVILQAHTTLVTGKPMVLHHKLSGTYPYQTRAATNGNIRLSNGQSTRTFKYKAITL